MATAIYLQTPYEIIMPMNHIMRYVSSYAKFDGWKIKMNSKDDSESGTGALQFMKKVKYSSITAKEQCEDLLLHYTEAQLINRLEKENIGRPSTYTSILDSVEKYMPGVLITNISITDASLGEEDKGTFINPDGEREFKVQGISEKEHTAKIKIDYKVTNQAFESSDFVIINI
jgi:hypothetical protein